MKEWGGFGYESLGGDDFEVLHEFMGYGINLFLYPIDYLTNKSMKQRWIMVLKLFKEGKFYKVDFIALNKP